MISEVTIQSVEGRVYSKEKVDARDVKIDVGDATFGEDTITVRYSWGAFYGKGIGYTKLEGTATAKYDPEAIASIAQLWMARNEIPRNVISELTNGINRHCMASAQRVAGFSGLSPFSKIPFLKIFLGKPGVA